MATPSYSVNIGIEALQLSSATDSYSEMRRVNYVYRQLGMPLTPSVTLGVGRVTTLSVRVTTDSIRKVVDLTDTGFVKTHLLLVKSDHPFRYKLAGASNELTDAEAKCLFLDSPAIAVGGKRYLVLEWTDPSDTAHPDTIIEITQIGQMSAA